MLCRWDCRPVCRDADRWATLLFGRCGPRALRLWRLKGRRLAESMSAELLLAELLCRVGEAGSFALEEDAHGRPFLVGSPLSVSLSHSGGYVSAAVADKPIGVDLQELRPVSEGVLRRFYSEEERDWIDAGDRRVRAMRLWTMKEAQVKLTGAGIAGGIRFFASFAGDELQTEYDGLSFLFPEAPEGLLFSVCLQRGEGSPSLADV